MCPNDCGPSRWQACGWAAWAAVAILSVAPATAAAADADLRPLVDQLAAPDPAERAAAEAALAAAGSRAIGVLSAAADDPRAEVATRGRRALRRVRLFAVRGGPDAAFPLAEAYLATDRRATRARLVAELAAVRPLPADVIVRLFTLEPDAGLRSQLLAAVGPAYRSAVPRLVADGDGDGLAMVLEGAAVDLPAVGAADYAADAVVTGRWDDAVARWRAELADGDEPRRAAAAVVLCHLYRAAGRAADAAEMAGRSGDAGLVLVTAIDRGDWAAAADATGACWPGPQAAGVRAVLLALAGRPAEAADAAATLDGTLRILVGQPARGLEVLATDPANGGDPVTAFALYQARGDYAAALGLADRFAGDAAVSGRMAGPRDDLRRLLGDLPPGVTPATADAATDAVTGGGSDDGWSRAVSDLAARRYAAAAADLASGDGDPDRVDWHYVRGYALAAAGDAGGQRLMADAARVPVADAGRRAWLAGRLDEAGLASAAAGQRSLGVRCGSPFAGAVGLLDLARDAGRAATAAGDWPAAAAAADRAVLLSGWPGLTFGRPAAYLAVAADAHLARARVARAAGDWAAVARELDAAGAFLPYSTDVPLEWVPALDAGGDHAAADARFAAAYDHLDAAAAAHPRSPYLHNQAAWLAACCCRRLDAAVGHAEAAVRLSPAADRWQYLDTLAECRFRQGDRAAAADLERRAAASPAADAAYVGRQLRRFATTDVPSTTRPSPPPT